MEGAIYGGIGALLFFWWNKNRKAKQAAQAAKDSEQSQPITQEENKD